MNRAGRFESAGGMGASLFSMQVETPRAHPHHPCSLVERQEAMATLKRVGSIAARLRELPYEKRVCRVEQYPSFWPQSG